MDQKFKTTYNSKDNILEDFFKPSFRNNKNTKICSAYFSSSILLDLFDEIDIQLSNGGSFQLILGEGTLPEEIEKMQSLVSGEEGAYIFDKLFSNISSDNVTKLKKLKLFIQQGSFAIKVGKTKNENAIFHNKLYIFHNGIYDFGVAASGSLNFTNSGMYNNYENLVLRESLESFRESMSEFENLWSNSYDGTTVLPISEYVIKKVEEKIEHELSYNDPPLDIDTVVVNDPIIKYNVIQRVESYKKLRDYQLEAIRNITSNNYCGILKMATGTGKTFTAMGIINNIMFEDKLSGIIHISVPYQHLAEQWGEEIIEFFGDDVKVVICHSGRKNWQQKVKNLMRIKKHYKIVLVFVNDSFFNYLLENDIDNNTTLLIDEVHNITTFNINKILRLKNYKYRIGLSATPEDEFDEKRTENLFEYFDDIQFQFALKRAITDGFLTPYLYFPKKIELNERESFEYNILNDRLNATKDISLRKKLEDEQIEILSQAEKKILQFEKDILTLTSKSSATNTIIYCSPGKLRKNLNISFISQINESIYNINNSIHVNKITYEESAETRKEYTKLFKEKKLHMLCAVKCLDEGYNIPCIEKAFILYSTKRNREYVQRRGRLLRKFEGKDISVIYDYIIHINGEILDFEHKRFKEYASLAKNKDAIMKEFYE